MTTTWIDPDEYWDGGGSSSTKVASVVDWESGLDAQGDAAHIGELGPTSGSADIPSDSIVVNWSYSSNQLTLKAKSGYEHDGTINGGSLTHARVHQTATSTSGDHLFKIFDQIDFIDLDLRSDSTEPSAELFRYFYTRDTSWTRCFLGFKGNTDQQDVVYIDDDTSANFTFISCAFYDIGRSIFDCYDVDGVTINVSFNSCVSYNIGADGARSGGCWFGADVSPSTLNVKSFNNLASVNDDYFAFGDSSNATSDHSSDYNLMSCGTQNDAFDTSADTGSQVSKTFVQGNPASGQIGLIDITTSPYDLRIYDDSTDNLAQDFHSVETGANSGLSIPNDIVGTVRGASEDHDCGFFEVTVGGTTLAPTTLAPTTLAPTTLAPTTLPPTTVAPTTLPPVAPTSVILGPLMGPLGGPI